jgi:hypothetical protein
MMAEADYDPHAAADLWRRMDRLGGGGPAILSFDNALKGPR